MFVGAGGAGMTAVVTVPAIVLMVLARAVWPPIEAACRDVGPGLPVVGAGVASGSRCLLRGLGQCLRFPARVPTGGRGTLCGRLAGTGVLWLVLTTARRRSLFGRSDALVVLSGAVWGVRSGFFPVARRRGRGRLAGTKVRLSGGLFIQGLGRRHIPLFGAVVRRLLGRWRSLGVRLVGRRGPGWRLCVLRAIVLDLVGGRREVRRRRGRRVGPLARIGYLHNYDLGDRLSEDVPRSIALTGLFGFGTRGDGVIRGAIVLGRSRRGRREDDVVALVTRRAGVGRH